MNASPQQRLKLIYFIGWTLIFSALFYLSPFYARLIVMLCEFLLQLKVKNIELSLVHNQLQILNPITKQGAIFAGFNVFIFTYNVVFAPALVLATLGLSFKSLVRAAAAVGIMIFLHVIYFLVALIYFMPASDNPVFYVKLPAWLIDISIQLYQFLTIMGFALLPFLAWMLSCLPNLSDMFGFSDPAVLAKREKSIATSQSSSESSLLLATTPGVETPKSVDSQEATAHKGIDSWDASTLKNLRRQILQREEEQPLAQLSTEGRLTPDADQPASLGSETVSNKTKEKSVSMDTLGAWRVEIKPGYRIRILSDKNRGQDGTETDVG